MPRVYHNGAAGIAPPPAPDADAVLRRSIDLLYVDPVGAGIYVKINFMPARKGL